MQKSYFIRFISTALASATMFSQALPVCGNHLVSAEENYSRYQRSNQSSAYVGNVGSARDVQSLERQNKILESKVAEQSDEIKRLKLQIESQQKQISELNTLEFRVKKELEEIRDGVTKQAQLEEKCANLQNKNAEIKKELEESKQEIKKLQDSYANLRVENAEIKSTNKNLQKELNNLQNNHNTLQENHANLQKDHTTLKKNYDNLKNETNSLSPFYNKFGNQILDQGRCGNSAFWTLTKDGTLTVFGSGEMDNYSQDKLDQRPWHKYISNIRKVSIEGSLASIKNLDSFKGFAFWEIIPTLEKEWTYNGHQYKFYLCGAFSWENAKKWCEEHGGYLATITSEKEQKALADNLSEYIKVCAYLGAEKTSGSWKWVTGEPFEYTAWNDGEPSFSGNIEFYLGILKWSQLHDPSKLWNDYPIYSEIGDGFIMEIDTRLP